MSSASSSPIPDMMKLNWEGIALERFPVKFGQVLKFDHENFQLKAIVLDFNEDEGGLWIGFCFINEEQLFGRQIPSGLFDPKCLNLLDLTYLHVEALTHYEVVETLAVNKSKVGIGSQSPAKDLSRLKISYDQGIEQRKKEQIPFDQGLMDLDPVRECYFDLQYIKK